MICTYLWMYYSPPTCRKRGRRKEEGRREQDQNFKTLVAMPPNPQPAPRADTAFTSNPVFASSSFVFYLKGTKWSIVSGFFSCALCFWDSSVLPYPLAFLRTNFSHYKLIYIHQKTIPGKHRKAKWGNKDLQEVHHPDITTLKILVCFFFQFFYSAY